MCECGTIRYDVYEVLGCGVAVGTGFLNEDVIPHAVRDQHKVMTATNPS